MRGWSELIFGSMYCGKSEELMRRMKRVKLAGVNYKLFKPSIDDRYSHGKVLTHDTNRVKEEIEKIVEIHLTDSDKTKDLVRKISDQLEGCMEATVIKDSNDILYNIDDTIKVVGIDEVQFFDDGLIDVIDKLEEKGIRVIMAGLDMYSSGEPFSIVPILACKSKYVDKLHAVCVDCGIDAAYSFKTNCVDDVSVIDVGSTGKYIALCGNCRQIRINKT